MKTVFLHSMFRAGSTFMFNKFRTVGAWPYYEPLHHDLSRLDPDSLDIWRFTKKATDAMRHPALDKPHFHEYSCAFDDKGKLPHFDTRFGYNNYSSPPQELARYIENLVSSTPTNLLPVLQFNRTSLRMKWFKNQFPAGLHIFLLRNPIDQFQSYLNRGNLGSNVFLSLNLLIYFNNRELFPDKLIKNEYLTVEDVYLNINNLMLLSKSIPIIDHFNIFLHIWYRSIIQAKKHADLIIDMDKMGTSESYKLYISDSLSSYHPQTKINFNDFFIKTHKKNTISHENMRASLHLIYDFYLTTEEILPTDFISYYLDHFLKSGVPDGNRFGFLTFFHRA